MIFVAHGIGGIRDLPVPESFFLTTSAIVLVLSFIALGLLWKRPQLERRSGGRRLPALVGAIVLSLTVRIVLQTLSVFLGRSPAQGAPGRPAEGTVNPA